jgi:hypothetical protein
LNKNKLLLLTTLLAATAGAFVVGSGLQVAVFADGFPVEATTQGPAGPHAVVQVGGRDLSGDATICVAFTGHSSQWPIFKTDIPATRVWQSQLEACV